MVETMTDDDVDPEDTRLEGHYPVQGQRMALRFDELSQAISLGSVSDELNRDSGWIDNLWDKNIVNYIVLSKTNIRMPYFSIM